MQFLFLCFILCLAGSVAQAGDLEEKWTNDVKKAQSSLANPDGKTSSLGTKDFQTKKFDLKTFSGFQGAGIEKKPFATKDFNSGLVNSTWQSKAFSTKTATQFSQQSSLVKNDQNAFIKNSNFNQQRFGNDKTAREDGIKSLLEKEQSMLQDMRYQGPEAKKISEEMKIINDTLKNKKDLKDHKISIGEIKDILNKE